MSENAKTPTPRNNSKNRTHTPVEGFTIEALRTKKLEDLLDFAYETKKPFDFQNYLEYEVSINVFSFFNLNMQTYEY